MCTYELIYPEFYFRIKIEKVYQQKNKILLIEKKKFLLLLLLDIKKIYIYINVCLFANENYI